MSVHRTVLSGGGAVDGRLASEDVAETHAIVIALTLLALVLLPCVIAAVICADDVLDHLVARRRRRRADRELRRLERRLDPPGSATPAGEQRPTIEWLAADLRRLDRQRTGVACQSFVWHQAVLEAYDNRLQLASRCLGVTEHLGELDGIDREIERVRVEGQLQAAGLALRCTGPD